MSGADACQRGRFARRLLDSRHTSQLSLQVARVDRAHRHGRGDDEDDGDRLRTLAHEAAPRDLQQAIGVADQPDPRGSQPGHDLGGDLAARSSAHWGVSILGSPGPGFRVFICVATFIRTTRWNAAML